MTKPPEDSVEPRDRAEWRAWLEDHHERDKGVWLITAKKASGRQAMDYGEAVEEALCFGWVDSKGGSLDEERSMLWFAPRRAGSGWARSNKERVERLIAEGRMAPAGLAKIEAAKRDGSWTVLDSVENLEVPGDLADALGARPGATENFANFPRSVRRSILEWIALARRAETRAKRVEETARLAERNERANQGRKP